MSNLKPLARSLQPLMTSSRKLASVSQESVQRAEFASKRARLLLGQFRKGEANDPATFVHSVAAVLARFPEDIVVYVTDPRTGLASKSDWMPTVREVSEECVRIYAEQAEQHKARERDRAQIEARRCAESDRSMRPTIAELRKKYGPAWGMDGKHGGDDRNDGLNAQALTRSYARTIREWEAAGELPPTIGGIPISRSLAANLGLAGTKK